MRYSILSGNDIPKVSFKSNKDYYAHRNAETHYIKQNTIPNIENIINQDNSLYSMLGDDNVGR